MNRDTAPYVQAILETAVEPWLKTLRQVDRRLREDNLVSALDDPSMPMQDKREKLRPALGDSPLATANLVYTMAGNGHLHLLERMIGELETDLERIGKGVTGTVRSAVPLTADQKARLAAKLTAQYGQELVLTYEIDESVVGGLVVRVGDLVIDGSVASRLAALREKLA